MRGHSICTSLRSFDRRETEDSRAVLGNVMILYRGPCMYVDTSGSDFRSGVAGGAPPRVRGPGRHGRRSRRPHQGSSRHSDRVGLIAPRKLHGSLYLPRGQQCARAVCRDSLIIYDESGHTISPPKGKKHSPYPRCGASCGRVVLSFP